MSNAIAFAISNQILSIQFITQYVIQAVLDNANLITIRTIFFSERHLDF